MTAGELGGRAAIVTGGSSGLGREVALAYASAGASVVVSSNVPPRDEEVAAECRAEGGRAIAVPADVRSEEDVRALVARCLSELGRLDVLVAAAGLDVRETEAREDRYVHRLTLEQWRTVIETNLTGTFLTVREAVPAMLDNGSGSIVTFSSGTVRHPRPGLTAYVGSKAGIEGFTRVLAEELRPHGIRANAIHPGGMTDTGFFPPWTTAAERAAMHHPAVIRGLAVWVAADASKDVTGRSLVATEWNREHGVRLCHCPACNAA